MSEQKILIVEDELLTAESISMLLEEEDYTVIGIARDAATALRLSSQPQAWPTVVICDIGLRGDVSGIELAAQLKQLYNCSIIFLTAFSDTKTVGAAAETDPVMYLVKPYTDSQLLVAVQMACLRMLRQTDGNTGSTPILQLTDREKEVALLAAQGLSSKQIARRLDISIETVKTHRRRMMSRNNISSFPQLVYLLNKQE
ncbi:MAG: response regulator transcription factor [Chitinophagaceae bacterium]|nr:response regulator transcription factor [Chitinophagaceae bacterium]